MIDYIGPVTLGCEEGGYATAAIELDDLKKENKSLFGFYTTSANLAEIIEENFKFIKTKDGSGDKKISKLHIRIEEI